ncbi:chemotaxis protein [Geomonas sp. Red276]
MKMSLKTLSFRSKLVLLVLSSCFVLGAPTGFIALREFITSHSAFVETYKKSLHESFDLRAKSEVELAVSTLQRIYDRHKNGEMTLDQAKALGADIIRNMRYGKGSYVWADTSQGVNVAMMGRADIEGKSRWDQQDVNGKYMMREIIKAGKQPGGGYTDYWFPKPGESKPLPKRSYSVYFEPFDWIIGTGNYIDDIDQVVNAAASVSSNRIKNGIYLILGVTLVVLIFVSLLTHVVTRWLLKSVGAEPTEMESIAQTVAQGDLTVSIEAGRSGIYEAMRQMVGSLRQVMEKVNQSSREVSRSASKLNNTSREMTDGANDVVSRAATVATASEEMSATSSDIALNCHQAAESSNRASSVARDGAGIVRETVEGMGRIAEKVRHSAGAVEQLGSRSQQIGDIICTIEDIADQTNLLALNAAIEAARAGEQGRGFAVVADEVRALAERTTKATREIDQMIKAIQSETKLAVRAMEEGVEEVEKGSVGAAKSGEALEMILQQIYDVTAQINQIATAAEEQTATTREITQNIHDISNIVRSSAEGAEEMSHSSAGLSNLSNELQEIVQRFRV